MATSAPALARHRRATPASAVIIRRVFFSEQHAEIKVQLQCTEGDPRSFHVLRTPTVPVSAFAHSPGALLDSEAWAAFVTSDAFGHWRQLYPAAFDAAETTLGLQAAAQDPDTLMEWDVALSDTFDGVAEDPICPVCYEDLRAEVMVAQKPCRHVLCIGCARQWRQCPVCRA